MISVSFITSQLQLSLPVLLLVFPTATSPLSQIHSTSGFPQESVGLPRKSVNCSIICYNICKHIPSYQSWMKQLSKRKRVPIVNKRIREYPCLSLLVITKTLSSQPYIYAGNLDQNTKGSLTSANPHKPTLIDFGGFVPIVSLSFLVPLILPSHHSSFPWTPHNVSMWDSASVSINCCIKSL